MNFEQAKENWDPVVKILTFHHTYSEVESINIENDSILQFDRL